VEGYAFGVHAEPRATKDLDLFILPDEANSERCFAHSPNTELLSTVSVRLILWTAQCSRSASLPPEWTFCSTSTVSVSIRPGKNRIEGLVDGEVRTVVISKDDLIQNKFASGREQDLLDVKKLRAAVR
jgi:hypothetical protein